MVQSAKKAVAGVYVKKKYIDAVKGFCILLVVMAHAGGIPIIGGILTACYMQVFFFIGGITYKDRNQETFKSFAMKKGKRLLMPYFAYATILLIIDALFVQRNIAKFLIGGGGILYARHCLLIYHGHENNIFLLDNLNGQLWFLPAMFVTYLLFWVLVKASKKERMVLIVLYFFVNIATNFLQILLPWSLDTVFVTSIVMYLGYCSKKYISYIETLNFKLFFRPKVFLEFFCMMMVYCIAIKVNGGINTSVRIFGDYKVFSIFLYIIIGYIGALAYMTTFSVCENTAVLKKLAGCFEYLGQRTIEILASHILIFKIVEELFDYAGMTNGYMLYICRITAAVIVGIIISNIINKFRSVRCKNRIGYIS